LSGTRIRGTQNQRLKGASPRGIRTLKPPKKSNQGSTYTDTPSQAHIRVKTGHPRLRSDSHEARSMRSLDPGKSPTRTTRGRVGRPPLIHLLTDKAFNAITSTNVATAPPAWEQHPCLILLFTAHPEMDGKKDTTIHTTSSTVLSTTPPRRARRQPPCLGFLGLGIIRSSSTPSITSRPGLERRRSTEEQRPYVDHRGSHARHRTQGLSPSRHQRHDDTPGMVGIHRCTSPQQSLQRPPRLHP
jgi:hypothetical protein